MEFLRKAVSSRERGAALIIVLAFVVLLTGVSIAYLSLTTNDRQVAHSSFHQSKVDQLAQSAMDLVIGDFQREIANGSSPTPSPSPTVSPIPTPSATPFVYPLTNPANIVAMRWPSPTPGTTPAIPNLIRGSLRYDELGGADAIPSPSPGVASHASAVSSTAASANGRLITLPRWNKHYLIPRSTASPTPSPTDTTPIAAFTAPDWVILTREGPVAFSTWDARLADPLQANRFYCVGRYAYAVYDEAGLLDANVAGYPSNTTATQYGPKGVSAFADLTALGMSQSDINAIVGWRNYFSAGPSGTFPNFSFNATAATKYVTSVLANTNGFMTVPVPSSTPNNMSNTDQVFTSRRGLVQLVLGSLSANAVNALQYLGTFSRETNAPSWAPTLNATDMGALNNGTGNIYAYATNANSNTTTNPTLLSVRVINFFTRADGNAAIVGEPLINRRFPLTRLAGLGPTGIVTTTNSTIVNGVPSVATPATIQRDLGLLWNSTSNRWDYVGPSGSTVLTSIETLAQVANENPGREPNFFELLKAVILSGSVGMGSGSANTFVAAEHKYYDSNDTTHGTSSDYQIMQIGANIISQWDSTNVPTFIGFGSDQGTSQPYELAGVKNLPYLSKLVFKPYFHGSTFEAWLLPTFWNPHRNAPPASRNVRLSFASGTMTANTQSPNTTSPLPSTEYMTIDANSFATTPSGPTSVGQTSGNVTRTPDNPRYYGFHFPQVAAAPTGLTTAYPAFGSGCDFAMQVDVTGSGAWKTYQKWTQCAQPATPLKCQSPSNWNLYLQDPEFVALDPRTLRLGVWGNAANQGVSADYTDGTLGTLDWPPQGPNPERYEHITGLPPQGSFFHASTSTDLYKYATNADATVYYTDLDGVQRLGDFLSPGATTPMLPSDSNDRPLVLAGAFQNGVFQSVAELGHVFRDQPWKALNFTSAMPLTSTTSPRSADAGLLDIFTLHESSMEAGKTSLNTKQPLVLKAILAGAIKRLNDSTTGITATQCDNIVTALMNLTSNQPMVNKAELVTPISNTRTSLVADASVTGLGNKEAQECALRAFSDSCQTRTWNLMIDLVAQTGRYPSNANSLAGFVVEGEQHYWVHLAIDRFTGQVIDKQIEVVTE
jgi:hypothetical protein